MIYDDDGPDDRRMWLDDCPMWVALLLIVALVAAALYAFDHPSTWLYGDLYRTTIDEAEIGVVVATNSTPEPDGTVKRYALLVPPEHQTAHAAVASTFGLTASTYAPIAET